jgi:REP element-mobilizing transposase RayT
MARPLRTELPGALYLVTTRGVPGARVFRDDLDRTEFLKVYAQVNSRMHWRLYAYALLDDHYLLVVDTPQPNLSRGMRQLNGVYTQHYNQRHGTTGKVFQGRFKAVLVDRN